MTVLLMLTQTLRFQSTLPRGERQFALYKLSATIDFNPRSHEGSDDTIFRRDVCFLYFNPRSHEGSDPNENQDYWANTGFQSTLPRGERPQCKVIGYTVSNFNPRSHEGSDCHTHKERQFSVPISIHAPTRGATLQIVIRQHRRCDFNPRSHEGSDNAYDHTLFLITTFQSTLPRGERRGMTSVVSNQKDFNPRSHEGSDAISARIPIV